jgi:hypothetical protein
MALQSTRGQEYKELERNLIDSDLQIFWETFIANDYNVKLFMMLGNLFHYDILLGKIFDDSSKRLLRNLWEERKKILKI